MIDNLYYILKDKKPVSVKDFAEYAEFMEIRDNSIIQQDTLDDGVFVSTVFLGINHSHSDDKQPPILFETMIFDGRYDQYQVRYSTWEEAERGHQDALKLAKSANPPQDSKT